MYTVEEKIQIAQISQYLSTLDNLRLGLNAGGNDLRLPRKLYMIRKNVEWLYDLDNSDSTLAFTSNYLYALCGKYANAAARRINAGGNIAPVTPSGSNLLNDLDWKISTTASGIAPLSDGQSSVTFNGTNGMPDLRGYNIDFYRGGVTQNTTPLGDGSSYYYWNRITGLFQLLGGAPSYGAAQLDELFRISPDFLTNGTVYNIIQPVLLSLDTDGTYTLPDGYFIYKINIKPTCADTVRIGTTLNGEEIMMDKTMTPDVYGSNGVTADVFADGADQTIYFTGFTTSAQISIYILPIE